MGLHYGKPRNSLRIGGVTGWTNTGKNRSWIAHQFWRPVTWWIGLSWGGGWFIGFIRTGDQVYRRTPDKDQSL